jgi:hypothetical protein
MMSEPLVALQIIRRLVKRQEEGKEPILLREIKELYYQPDFFESADYLLNHGCE